MTSDAEKHGPTGGETEKIPVPRPDGVDEPKQHPEWLKYASTERDIRSTVNVGLSNVNSELREEFLNTATAAMNEVIEDFRELKISCYNCMQKLDVSTLRSFSHFECPVCGADLIVPEWFDNYLLESPEGMGGMATVYKALDKTLDREVAVKVLSPAVAQDKERCELFLNEARTAATINHFAVIPVYTCGVFEEQPYIVMQFMKNGSLEEKVSTSNPPAIIDLLQWLKDVAEGLECASKHGIVHHDIKPGNIMLDNAGVAKIGDFGIAQAINDSRASKIFEMTKAWVSPHYVSPEKAVSNKEDYRGDIYSLGASFYHLATGHTPFRHDDIEELIKQRLMRVPIPPNRLRKEIPRRLSNLIMAMLSVEPQNRPDYKDIIIEVTDILSKLKKSGNTSPLSVEDSRRKQLRKFFIVIGVLVAWMILVPTIYYSYVEDQPAGLDKPVGSRRTDPGIMQAAGCFRLGDPVSALKVANELVKQKNISPKDLKVAAVQLAIGCYLTNNRYAEDNCSYASKRIYDAGISPAAPSAAIIGFLMKRKLSPEDLRTKLQNSHDKMIVFLGNYAIFIREVYAWVREESTERKVAAEFDVLNASAATLNANNWADCWKARLPIYKKILNKEALGGEKLEPLFEKVLGL